MLLPVICASSLLTREKLVIGNIESSLVFRSHRSIPNFYGKCRHLEGIQPPMCNGFKNYTSCFQSFRLVFFWKATKLRGYRYNTYNIQVIQVVHTIEIISLVYFRDHTYILKTGSNNSTNNGTHYSSEQDTRFLKEN